MNAVLIFLLAVVGIILLIAIFVYIFSEIMLSNYSKPKYSDEERFRFVSWYMSIVTSVLFNVSTEVVGLEYLDQVKTGVIYGNHQSNFDIIAMLKGIKRRHGYVAKKELGNLVIVTKGMKLIRCEFMDRSDVRQSVKTIASAAKTVQSGHLMVIFPEGTRQINAPIGSFKAGSFKLAEKAKADIIPITIFNSHEVEKRFPRHTRVKIEIHPPISYETYSSMPTNELCEKVERIIKEPLNQSV